MPVLKNLDLSVKPSAKAFFGIVDLEYEHLFLPNRQKPEFFGGRMLGVRARKESVAKNIYAFLDRMEK